MVMQEKFETKQENEVEKGDGHLLTTDGGVVPMTEEELKESRETFRSHGQIEKHPGLMMPYGKTAVLYFDMTDQDVVDDFQDVLDARKMSSAIWEIGSKLRDIYKHGFAGTKDDLIELVRDHYYQVLSDHDISRVGY
jgi:hypothetical protein